MLNWQNLSDTNQLNELIENSLNQKIIIFKHSTRCSISSMVKDRLERNWPHEFLDTKVYYLDLLKYRNISNSLAEISGIEHQSPQILIFENKNCTYFSNHNAIDAVDISKQL